MYILCDFSMKYLPLCIYILYIHYIHIFSVTLMSYLLSHSSYCVRIFNIHLFSLNLSCQVSNRVCQYFIKLFSFPVDHFINMGHIAILYSWNQCKNDIIDHQLSKSVWGIHSILWRALFEIVWSTMQCCDIIVIVYLALRVGVDGHFLTIIKMRSLIYKLKIWI